MCLCVEKVLMLFYQAFFGIGKMGAAMALEKCCHNVVHFNKTLDVKLQILIINKNIYSVLKIIVLREFECSFLKSLVEESVLWILKRSSRSLTEHVVYCLLEFQYIYTQKLDYKGICVQLSHLVTWLKVIWSWMSILKLAK